MDVNALQARLRAFAAQRDWQPFHSPKNLAMALMVEAAELLELFQWLTTAQSHTFTKNLPDKERVGDEMADVLLYLLQLADHTGVDLDEAVERKLGKNALKHPPIHPEPEAPIEPPPGPKVHLLVDWENVQPKGTELKALVPQGTDVWLFHGPQQRVDRSRHTGEYGDKQVTLVPSARAGKNSLDFHLTYYIGYISARQPDATFVVVSNDTGYDPLLEHVVALGFAARREAFQRKTGGQAQAAAVHAVPAMVQEASVGLPVDIPAAKPPAPDGMAAWAALSSGQSPPAAALTASVQAVSGAAKTKEASEKTTRQEVQALVQCLQRMKPSDRPAHREVLLAVIKAQLRAPSAYAPRVAHALAQLRAQQWVVLKGDAVSYPPRPSAAQALPQPAPVKKKTPIKVVDHAALAPAQAVAALRPPASPQAAVKKNTVAPSVPTPPLKKPLTPAQMACKVLASLAKMPGNRPTRPPALLALIRSQIGAAPGDDGVATQVFSLLQAQGAVAQVGAALNYPPPKPPVSANAA